MTPTFVTCVSRHLSDTAKWLSQSRVIHIVTAGASLHNCLAMCDSISTHTVLDYGRIWIVFTFATDMNIFKNLDSKIKTPIILLDRVQIN